MRRMGRSVRKNVNKRGGYKKTTRPGGGGLVVFCVGLKGGGEAYLSQETGNQGGGGSSVSDMVPMGGKEPILLFFDQVRRYQGGGEISPRLDRCAQTQGGGEGGAQLRSFKKGGEKAPIRCAFIDMQPHKRCDQCRQRRCPYRSAHVL